jgi:hypothetical protein
VHRAYGRTRTENPANPNPNALTRHAHQDAKTFTQSMLSVLFTLTVNPPVHTNRPVNPTLIPLDSPNDRPGHAPASYVTRVAARRRRLCAGTPRLDAKLSISSTAARNSDAPKCLRIRFQINAEQSSRHRCGVGAYGFGLYIRV